MVTERWRWVGERALLRAFEGDLRDANASARVVAKELGELAATDVVEDVVLGVRSVLLVLRESADLTAEIGAVLEGEPRRIGVSDETPVEIAVRYGGDDGPDLAEVARAHGLDERDVIRLHVEPVYVVAFVGFSPGFPYLLGLPDALATPRLRTPRTRVPGGSVGIGGRFTGIYPRSTPGGWLLIGRTDAELFDATRDPPALLAPGARVRFLAT